MAAGWIDHRIALAVFAGTRFVARCATISDHVLVAAWSGAGIRTRSRARSARRRMSAGRSVALPDGIENHTRNVTRREDDTSFGFSVNVVAIDRYATVKPTLERDPRPAGCAPKVRDHPRRASGRQSVVVELHLLRATFMPRFS